MSVEFDRLWSDFDQLRPILASSALATCRAEISLVKQIAAGSQAILCPATIFAGTIPKSEIAGSVLREILHPPPP